MPVPLSRPSAATGWKPGQGRSQRVAGRTPRPEMGLRHGRERENHEAHEVQEGHEANRRQSAWGRVRGYWPGATSLGRSCVPRSALRMSRHLPSTLSGAYCPPPIASPGFVAFPPSPPPSPRLRRAEEGFGGHSVVPPLSKRLCPLPFLTHAAESTFLILEG